jgi:hypothetical protein
MIVIDASNPLKLLLTGEAITYLPSGMKSVPPPAVASASKAF